MKSKNKSAAVVAGFAMVTALLLAGCTPSTSLPNSNSNDGGGTTDGNPNGQVSEYAVPLVITPKVDNDTYHLSLDLNTLDDKWVVEVDGVSGESAKTDDFKFLTLIDSTGACTVTVSTMYQPSHYYGRGDLFLSKDLLYGDSIASSVQPSNERSVGIDFGSGEVEFRAINFEVDNLIFGEDPDAEPTVDGSSTVIEAVRIFDVLLANGSGEQANIEQPFGSDPAKGLVGTSITYQCYNADVSDADFTNILDALSINGISAP